MSKFNDVDRIGQEKVLKLLPNIFSGYTLNFEQHIEDNGKIDIFMTASTESREYKYAIEAKDRLYPSFAFEDWVLEYDKYKELMKSYKKGYRPIYFNTFPDNKYYVWDMTKTNFSSGSMTSKKYTVVPSGKVTRDRLFCPISDAVFSGTTS